MVAQVRTQLRSCGICGGQSGTGASFLLIILLFPAAITIFLVLLQLNFLTKVLQWHTGDITPEAKQTQYVMRASTVLIQ
jgi:hypothetical protein